MIWGWSCDQLYMVIHCEINSQMYILMRVTFYEGIRVVQGRYRESVRLDTGKAAGATQLISCIVVKIYITKNKIQVNRRKHLNTFANSKRASKKPEHNEKSNKQWKNTRAEHNQNQARRKQQKTNNTIDTHNQKTHNREQPRRIRTLNTEYMHIRHEAAEKQPESEQQVNKHKGNTKNIAQKDTTKKAGRKLHASNEHEQTNKNQYTQQTN